MDREQLNRIRPGGAEEWKQRRAKSSNGEQPQILSQPPAGENTAQTPAGERKTSPVHPPAGERKTSPVHPPAGERKAAPAQAPAGERKAAPVQAPAGERKAAPVQAPAGERKAAPVQAPAGERKASPEQNPNEKLKRSYLVKLLAMLVLVGILVVFTTIAWFTMNKETGSSGMGVKIAGMPFELAVAGANVGAKSYIQTGTGDSATYDSGTEINSMSGAVKVEDGTLETYTYISNLSSGATSSGSFYTTGGSKESIKWRLSSQDNTNGLGPNSSGKFVFYIVPKQAGTLSVKISLKLEGYTADVSRNENNTFRASNLNIISEEDAQYQSVEYLNNHLLFFEDWTGDHEGASAPYYYRTLIEDGEFEVELENCVVDRLVPITVYWIWPNTFAQFTCIAANENVANASSEANAEDSSTVASLRSFVVRNRTSILKSDTDLIDMMAHDSSGGEGEPIYSFDPSSAAENLEELSMAYNLADQEIGTNIQYFLLTLVAE